MCVCVLKVQAQLGFCSGNSGAPIFTESFGTGIINNFLPVGTTTYNYNSGFPLDGQYTVSNGTFGNGFDWHQTQDHTTGDTNGKCLVVNAEFSAGEFYRTSVSGLCEATTYEFSAWLINLVRAGSFCSNQPGGTVPINVSFEIWDSTDTNLLANGNTGNIIETSSPNWQEFGLVFQTLAGQNSVILKMINAGQGGCGNDLAIDDIEFKSCGDIVSVSDSGNNNMMNLCSSQAPYVELLTASPNFSVFSTHFYQWQESMDGISWNDMVGETNQNLSVSVNNTTYFRAKMAEVAVNLGNAQCVIFSNEYPVTINQLPATPTLACWENAIINNTTCTWDVTGTQPIQPATACYETASFNMATCSWDITGTQPPQPVLTCYETATFSTSSCSWEISGIQPVQPATACYETATFNITTCSWDIIGTQPPQPQILACYETATFNTSSCAWEISGFPPFLPATACYETASFNSTTCSWDITGTQPPQQQILACYETATFNRSSCAWKISGVQPKQPATACYETAIFNNNTCSWDITGIQPPQPILACYEIVVFNNTTCSWNITGTQPLMPTIACWEIATFSSSSCSWEITGTQPGAIIEENQEFCEGGNLILQAQTNIFNPSYIWSTGDSSDEITVDTSGVYSVEISGGVCSFETRIFNVIETENPIIGSVVSQGNDIIITAANAGDFLYSIDGNIFQPSNTFYGVEGGLYTVYVKGRHCNYKASTQHLHFIIPKYFTPNNDGFHDTFSLAGIEYFGSSEVSIYDRYGKLLKYSRNNPFSWDGTFNNQILQTDDYWYVIVIEDKKFTGHFTLKR